MYNVLETNAEESIPLLPRNSTSINQGDGRSIAPNTDDEKQNNNRSQSPEAQGDVSVCSCLLYVVVITDWSWKIATYISGSSKTLSEPSINQKMILHCLQCLYSLTQLLVGTMGLFCQSLSCFRRDRWDQNVNRIPEDNNASRYVECHQASQLFSAIIVPDIFVFILLLWFFLRRVPRRCCKSCYLNNLVDEIRPKKSNLNDLVDEISPTKKPNKLKSVIFLFIPIIYAIFSLVTSIVNLFAFHFWDDNVIIHWPWFNIYGSSKNTLIVLSLIGFFAIDIFYTQLIMRYAFQCQMNIYFLEEIIRKIDNNTKNDERYKNQGDALEEIKWAEDFLRQLNEKSIVVGFIVLIGTLQATNCIINLSDEGNSYLQTVALALQLTHWVFLTLFPIYEAAQTNKASKQLHKTGLAIYRPLVRFKDNEDAEKKMIRKHASTFSLKAKLFGIAVHPSYPYVILILMLFTLMLGPSVKWYDRFL